jgi:hypothetical protein
MKRVGYKMGAATGNTGKQAPPKINIFYIYLYLYLIK